MKVDGRGTVFSSTGFNDLRVTCVPSRGVPVAYPETKAKVTHGSLHSLKPPKS